MGNQRRGENSTPLRGPHSAQFREWRESVGRYFARNVTVEKAFTRLRKEGCDREVLLQVAYYHSTLRIEPPDQTWQQNTEYQRLIGIAQTGLKQVVEALHRLNQSPITRTLPKLLRRTIADPEFLGRAAAKQAMLQWLEPKVKGPTRKSLSANDFGLAVICEYVKLVTGRPHHKEIALLLEAAWAGHGRSRAWTGADVAQKLRTLRERHGAPVIEMAASRAKEFVGKPINRDGLSVLDRAPDTLRIQ